MPEITEPRCEDGDLRQCLIGETVEAIREDTDEDGEEWTELDFSGGHKIHILGPVVWVHPR